MSTEIQHPSSVIAGSNLEHGNGTHINSRDFDCEYPLDPETVDLFLELVGISAGNPKNQETLARCKLCEKYSLGTYLPETEPARNPLASAWMTPAYSD